MKNQERKKILQQQDKEIRTLDVTIEAYKESLKELRKSKTPFGLLGPILTNLIEIKLLLRKR